MKRLIALFLLMVVISFSAFGKEGTIVRGNLEYITPSLVSNISPEYEEYKSDFKLDGKFKSTDMEYIKTLKKKGKDAYSLVKEIFPEDLIYDEEGNYIISHIACYFQPKTGNVAIWFIGFSRDIYSLNIDNYINLFYEEFSKKIKVPILDLPELDENSSFLHVISTRLIDEYIKEEQAKSIEKEDIKAEETSFLDRVWNWIVEIFN